MTIRVVDNKKLDMTQDEWNMYEGIVKSYTTPTNRGEDLFIDLFESDDSGIIIFLKPPSRRQSTLQVFLFLMALMQHQHLRLMHQQVEDVLASISDKESPRKKNK